MKMEQKNQKDLKSGFKAGLIGIAAFVVVCIMFGTFSGTEAKLGEQSVYDEIDDMNSCVLLQENFDISMDNAEARQPGDNLRDISLTYAEYINERMIKLGC